MEKRKKKNLKNDIDKKKEKELEKKFIKRFFLWIIIFAIGSIKIEFQNDTFYTIKIGNLILHNGIDMLDHFSFHSGLLYTYPHWFYDVSIYLIYKAFGLLGIHISNILLFIGLIFIVFVINKLISKNKVMAAFTTFLCAISISSFVAARAQLVSFLLFALEIFCIESFLEKKNKKYLLGLLGISLALCNVHVAVWPFYFILYLPYLAEFLIAWILERLKDTNKIKIFFNKKFDIEKNKQIKYLFLTMILSLSTGLLTPIKDTPYTYLIKTMMGNSQSYIQEHQMITWKDSPFTIIIVIETIILSIFSKEKLRDIFMILGVALMSITAVRHLSLLALIGTIFFSRIFSSFLEYHDTNYNFKMLKFFNKKYIIFISFVLVITFSSINIYNYSKNGFINEKKYPIEAVNYIKNNLDYKNIHLFNGYNYGSYLLLNDIPVFIDSRADLYTKQFSGLDYDIFDDYMNINYNYEATFKFYDITHVLLNKDNESSLYGMLKEDNNYEIIYEDKYFVLFKKTN